MKKLWPRHFRKTLFAVLWALPVVLGFFVVWKHSVPLPFWDEWSTPGAQLASWYRGTITFAELCSQHNESRKLIPRLIYLPLFRLAGWNVQLALGLTLEAICLVSIGLSQLARRTIHSATAASLAFAAMNLFLFSPRQYENLLNDLQWETFTPGLALIFALIVNLSRRSLASKTICNAVLALISTYTFANGMLVWLLAFPVATGIATSFRTTLVWRLAYIFGAAISIGAYFIGYQHPPLSPPLASFFKDGAALVHFVFIWFGSVFRVANPATVGGIVVLMFLTLAVVAAWLIVKRGEWKSHYPWLILGVYALFSGAITAVARLGFTFAMATSPHYTVFTVILYIAVTGLAFAVYEQLRGYTNIERGGALLGVVSALVLASLWTSTFTAERRRLKKYTEYRRHLLLVLRWAEALPQNPELAWLSPYADTAQTIHTLAEHDAFRPRLVSKTLAGAVNAAPTRDVDGAGVLEQAVPDGNGRFWVKGWARVPGENRPADCVVAGWQTAAGWEPRWVVELQPRSANSVSGAGFSWPLIATVPAGGATLRAWAIDLRRDQAYALAGEINFSALR
ncbi:MAG TPA: hypothetical protein VLH83_08765 [Chthoniobacterales bacterium]|nr:hypothetical protein [Chthoniobacterales bacterium]